MSDERPILCRIAGAIQRAMLAGEKGGGISAEEATLALAMLQFADCENGRTWPGKKTLAEMLNVTDRTIRRRREALVRVGLLVPMDQRGGRRRVAVYGFDADWQPATEETGTATPASASPLPQQKGDTNPASVSPFPQEKGDTNPASVSPFPQKGDTNRAKGGHEQGERGTQTPAFCPPNSRTGEQQQKSAAAGSLTRWQRDILGEHKLGPQPKLAAAVGHIEDRQLFRDVIDVCLKRDEVRPDAPPGVKATAIASNAAEVERSILDRRNRETQTRASAEQRRQEKARQLEADNARRDELNRRLAANAEAMLELVPESTRATSMADANPSNRQDPSSDAVLAAAVNHAAAKLRTLPDRWGRDEDSTARFLAWFDAIERGEPAAADGSLGTLAAQNA